MDRRRAPKRFVGGCQIVKKKCNSKSKMFETHLVPTEHNKQEKWCDYCHFIIDKTKNAFMILIPHCTNSNKRIYCCSKHKKRALNDMEIWYSKNNSGSNVKQYFKKTNLCVKQ